MELERYGAVVRRWAWLVVAIVLLTAIASAAYAIVHPTGWKATTQLLVNPLSSDQGAASSTPSYYYRPYYEELAAQFILDDYTGVIKGNTFSKDVIALLKQSPRAEVRNMAAKLAPDSLSKQFTVNRVNRLLKIDVAADSQDQAIAIANATDQVIVQSGPQYFASLGQTDAAQLGGSPPVMTVTVADQPHISAKPSLAKEAAYWLLRTLAGLAAALAIVFVLHYFDDRLYDAADVQRAVDLGVVGSVPAPPASESALARRPAGTPLRPSVAGALAKDRVP